MQILDLKTMELDREQKTKEVYSAEGLKVRVIRLTAGAEIPDCKMVSYVIFHVLQGNVEITVNQKPVTVNEGQALVCEPSTISMKSLDGAKIMGIQMRAPQR